MADPYHHHQGGWRAALAAAYSDAERELDLASRRWHDDEAPALRALAGSLAATRAVLEGELRAALRVQQQALDAWRQAQQQQRQVMQQIQQQPQLVRSAAQAAVAAAGQAKAATASPQQRQQQQQPPTTETPQGQDFLIRLAELDGRMHSVDTELAALLALLSGGSGGGAASGQQQRHLQEERELARVKVVVLQDTRRMLEEEVASVRSDLDAQRRRAAAAGTGAAHSSSAAAPLPASAAAAQRAAAVAAAMPGAAAEAAAAAAAVVAAEEVEEEAAAVAARAADALARCEGRLDRVRLALSFPRSRGWRVRGGANGIYFGTRAIHIAELQVGFEASLEYGADGIVRFTASLGGVTPLAGGAAAAQAAQQAAAAAAAAATAAAPRPYPGPSATGAAIAAAGAAAATAAAGIPVADSRGPPSVDGGASNDDGSSLFAEPGATAAVPGGRSPTPPPPGLPPRPPSARDLTAGAEQEEDEGGDHGHDRRAATPPLPAAAAAQKPRRVARLLSTFGGRLAGGAAARAGGDSAGGDPAATGPLTSASVRRLAEQSRQRLAEGRQRLREGAARLADSKIVQDGRGRLQEGALRLADSRLVQEGRQMLAEAGVGGGGGGVSGGLQAGHAHLQLGQGGQRQAEPAPPAPKGGFMRRGRSASSLKRGAGGGGSAGGAGGGDSDEDPFAAFGAAEAAAAAAAGAGSATGQSRPPTSRSSSPTRQAGAAGVRSSGAPSSGGGGGGIGGGGSSTTAAAAAAVPPTQLPRVSAAARVIDMARGSALEPSIVAGGGAAAAGAAAASQQQPQQQQHAVPTPAAATPSPGSRVVLLAEGFELTGEKGTRVPEIGVRELELDACVAIRVRLCYRPRRRGSALLPRGANVSSISSDALSAAEAAAAASGAPVGVWVADTSGAAAADGIARGACASFQVLSLERRAEGASVPLPPAILRTALNLAVPPLLSRALMTSLPPELGEHAAAAGGRTLLARGELRCEGPPLAPLRAPLGLRPRDVGAAAGESTAAGARRLRASQAARAALGGLDEAQGMALAALLQQQRDPYFGVSFGVGGGGAGAGVGAGAGAGGAAAFGGVNLGGGGLLPYAPRAPGSISELCRFYDRYHATAAWPRLLECWQAALDAMLGEGAGSGGGRAWSPRSSSAGGGPSSSRSFDFRALAEGPVATLSRQPVKLNLEVQRLEARLDVEAVLDSAHAWLCRLARDAHGGEPGGGAGGAAGAGAAGDDPAAQLAAELAAAEAAAAAQNSSSSAAPPSRAEMGAAAAAAAAEGRPLRLRRLRLALAARAAAKPLADQLSSLDAWHAGAARRLAAFTSRFSSGEAHVAAAGDARGFGLSLERARFEGPILLELQAPVGRLAERLRATAAEGGAPGAAVDLMLPHPADAPRSFVAKVRRVLQRVQAAAYGEASLAAAEAATAAITAAEAQGGLLVVGGEERAAAVAAAAAAAAAADDEDGCYREEQLCIGTLFVEGVKMALRLDEEKLARALVGVMVEVGNGGGGGGEDVQQRAALAASLLAAYGDLLAFRVGMGGGGGGAGHSSSSSSAPVGTPADTTNAHLQPAMVAARTCPLAQVSAELGRVAFESGIPPARAAALARAAAVAIARHVRGQRGDALRRLDGWMAAIADLVAGAAGTGDGGDDEPLACRLQLAAKAAVVGPTRRLQVLVAGEAPVVGGGGGGGGGGRGGSGVVRVPAFSLTNDVHLDAVGRLLQ
jgi:hypothetical protein